MSRALSTVALLLSLAVATPSLGAAPAAPGDPAIQKPIETLDDALLATMKAGKSLDFAARVQKLDPVIRSVFDLTYMAQVMAGRDRDKIAGADRSRVIDAFSRWAAATYATNFKGHGGH